MTFGCKLQCKLRNLQCNLHRRILENISEYFGIFRNNNIITRQNSKFFKLPLKILAKNDIKKLNKINKLYCATVYRPITYNYGLLIIITS